jgi:hypothetical protein
MTSVEHKKAERQQLATVVDLDIAPARIRSCMDKGWVNKSRERQVNDLKKDINKIKKEGCPFAKPVAPKSPGRDAKESDRKRYEEAKVVFVQQMKEYNDYKSPRYNSLNKFHGYVKQLQKLHTLLLKDKKTENTDYEIQAILHVLDDKPPMRKKGPSGESDEEYHARVNKFSEKGYKKLRTNSTSLTSPDGVQAELDRVHRENPDLKFFLDKDHVSKERVRFNDPAAVAISTFMQVAVGQFAEHTINQTIASGKKIMQPDHCVSPGLEKCSLFPLINNLPHYLTVVERQARRHEYELAREGEKNKGIQLARRKARNEKKNFVRPKFTYPSFQDVEVNNGFAVLREEEDKDNNIKKYYQWYDIDVERDESDQHDVNFQFYVGKVCRRVLDDRIAAGDTSATDIRVSNNLKKFLSDLIIDFITRITPLAMLLMESKNIKTINENIILTVVQFLLIDSYRKKQENMSLTKEHSDLFAEVRKKIKKCQEHQTGVVHKHAAELAEDELLDDDISEAVAHEEENGDELDDAEDSDEEEEKPKASGVKKAAPTSNASKALASTDKKSSGSVRAKVRNG